jgi:hypothetical protein
MPALPDQTNPPPLRVPTAPGTPPGPSTQIITSIGTAV